jgi:hypothetical protein
MGRPVVYFFETTQDVFKRFRRRQLTQVKPTARSQPGQEWQAGPEVRRVILCIAPGLIVAFARDPKSTGAAVHHFYLFVFRP